MKRRTLRIANFIAFNLLFFALYLNFIHKDKPTVPAQNTQQSATAFSGTTLVENPEKYLGKKNDVTIVPTMTQPGNDKQVSGSLKPSTN